MAEDTAGNKGKVKLWVEVEAGERAYVSFDRFHTATGEVLQDVVVEVCKTNTGRAFCADGITRSVSGGRGVSMVAGAV